jgi:glycosyltransferase involved in cell wall biosynthesis
MNQLRRRWEPLVATTKEVLKKEAPDVVLINGTYFAPWILAKSAEELGIPVVLRYAGVLQQEVSHKPFLTRKRLLNYERWVASMADEIIFPSTLCREVVEEFILREKTINGTVLPNPVSPGAWITHRSRGRYTLAAVGRWTAIKNFTAYTKVHEELLQKRWPHRAILVTSKKALDAHIPETIERRDPMSQQDLLKFYRSIDLLIVPSHFETFCNVAAEAVVLGTSVLVSENVGFSEILKKAGLGRMVIPSFDDVEVVARAIKRLSKTRVTKKERDAVAALLDPQRVHNGILRVLRHVVSPRLTR